MEENAKLGVTPNMACEGGAVPHSESSRDGWSASVSLSYDTPDRTGHCTPPLRVLSYVDPDHLLQSSPVLILREALPMAKSGRASLSAQHRPPLQSHLPREKVWTQE